MGKIKTLTELAKICHRLKKEGKTIGLITGCFDILHIGHVVFFRLARKQVDILLVGLENDRSISLSKGKTRPVFPFEDRALVVAELQSIDYVFKIEDIYNFSGPNANSIQESVIAQLMSDVLITETSRDRYWKTKKKRAEEFGIRFSGLKASQALSSSMIISKLEKEF